MIDTHCHLLPYLDDGARDWDMALAMARAASEDGIRQAVVTPHWTGTEGETEAVRARLQELEQRLAAAGLDLRLHLGNEVVLVPRLVESLEQGTAFTLAGSNYVLLETAQLEQGAYNYKALFQLQSHGYRVILAHPERVPSWQREFHELRRLLEHNCFLQVTAASLTGGFGKNARRAAEDFLDAGWVAILASDAHSANSRPMLLAEALHRAEELVGETAAHSLVYENPARILCNELLPYPELDSSPRRRSFFSFPWLRHR